MRNGIHIFDAYIFYDKMEFPFLVHLETESQVFRNGKYNFLKRKITVSRHAKKITTMHKLYMSMIEAWR